MNTTQTVKQKLIDHLAQMDMNKLSFADLEAYVRIIGCVSTMEKPDYMESLARYAASGFCCNTSAIDGKEGN